MRVKESVEKANNTQLPANERQYWAEHADFERKQENKIRTQINNITEKQIPQLGRTMAALKTKPLFGDEQVVLQQ